MTPKWTRPVARFPDRLSRPRFTTVMHEGGMRTTAGARMVIAGATITAFGLAGTVCDGMLARVALGFIVGGLGLVGHHDLG